MDRTCYMTYRNGPMVHWRDRFDYETYQTCPTVRQVDRTNLGASPNCLQGPGDHPTTSRLRTTLRSTRNMLRSYHRIGMADCCGRRTCAVVALVSPVAFVASLTTLAVTLTSSRTDLQTVILHVVVDIVRLTSTTELVPMFEDVVSSDATFRVVD